MLDASVPPVALVLEHTGAENLFQLFDLLVGKQVFFRRLARTFIAVRHVRIQVCFIPAIVKFADSGLSFGLTRQKVNFFKILSFLLLLHDELAVTCGGGELHLIQWAIFAPLIAFFPAVNGCNFLAQHFSNAGYAVSLKVHQHCLTTGIEVCGGQCCHGTNIRPQISTFPGFALCGSSHKPNALFTRAHHRKHKALNVLRTN